MPQKDRPIWRKNMYGFEPASESAQDFFHSVHDGELIYLEGHKAKNLKLVRKWWVLVGLLAKHNVRGWNKDQLHDDILISLGKAEPFIRADGQVQYRLRGISSMSKDEFDKFYEDTLTYAANELMPPGTDRPDIERELMTFY